MQVDIASERKAEAEPFCEILSTPARVVPVHEKYIKFFEESRYVHIKLMPSGILFFFTKGHQTIRTRSVFIYWCTFILGIIWKFAIPKNLHWLRLLRIVFGTDFYLKKSFLECLSKRRAFQKVLFISIFQKSICGFVWF